MFQYSAIQDRATDPISVAFIDQAGGWGGGVGTPYNGLYGEGPPKRGTFSGVTAYERVGILLVEVYKRLGKYVIWICERAQIANRWVFLAL